MREKGSDAEALYRLEVQSASALRLLGRFADALEVAERALEVRPTGKEALVNAVYAAIGNEELAKAARICDTLTVSHPDETATWIAHLHLEFEKSGDSETVVPEVLANSPEVILARAELAIRGSHYAAALPLLAKVREAGVRTPALLVAMIAAEVGEAHAKQATDETLWGRVEKLATEALDLLPSERHPLVAIALANRSEARKRLGKKTDSEADTDRLLSLDPDDPNGMRQRARALAEAGDLHGAYAVLGRPAAEHFAETLAFRAQLAAEIGRGDDARRDIALADKLVERSVDPVLARAQLLEAAMELGDDQLVDSQLRVLETTAGERAPVLVLKARWLAKRGEIDGAIAAYHAGAKADSTTREDVLCELGAQAIKWGRPEESLAAFEAVGANKIPRVVLGPYARALMANNRLKDVGALLEDLLKEVNSPIWALGLAAELATRQGDVEAQVAHLTKFVQRRESDATARLYLCKALWEADRQEEARAHLEQLLQLPALTARERVQAAQFLREAGQSERAIKEAHTAFRHDPNDAAVVRAFVATVLFARGTPPDITTVGYDTAIELVNTAGEPRRIRVPSVGPVVKRAGEFTREEAEAIGIWGATIGAKARSGSGNKEEWVIERILSLAIADANDAAQAFEGQFPLEPFFLRAMSVGDGNVGGLAEIIATVHQRGEFVKNAIKAQRADGWPLSMLAQMVGVSVIELMGNGGATKDWGPAQVEWADRGGQERTVALLSNRPTLVLTRGAVRSIMRFRLGPALAATFRMVAPMSLRGELRQEKAEADAAVINGRSTLAPGGPGLAMIQVAPGDQSLVQEAAILSEEQQFLGAEVSLFARPLEVVADDTPQRLSIRDAIGPSAYDAAALAAGGYGMLYADDLGLRRLDVFERPLMSCSTVTLAIAMGGLGAMPVDSCNQLLIDLSRTGYPIVRPTTELLGWALAKAPERGQQIVADAMSLLGTGTENADESAALLIDAIRANELLGIAGVDTVEVIAQGLKAVLSRWQVRDIVPRLLRYGERRLLFLPTAHDALKTLCTRAVKAGLPSVLLS